MVQYSTIELLGDFTLDGDRQAISLVPSSNPWLSCLVIRQSYWGSPAESASLTALIGKPSPACIVVKTVFVQEPMRWTGARLGQVTAFV